MDKVTDLDGVLMEFRKDYPLGLYPMHMMQTEEDKQRLIKLQEELKEICKDVDFKVVLPKADYNPIVCARDFIESSQFWDERILGAEEEYVGVCSDPELLGLVRQLAQGRSKEKMMKPSFLDEQRSKLRKGRDHHKFKKENRK